MRQLHSYFAIPVDHWQSVSAKKLVEKKVRVEPALVEMQVEIKGGRHLVVSGKSTSRTKYQVKKNSIPSATLHAIDSGSTYAPSLGRGIL